MNRRLYRCSHDRRIAGVAAGVAEYFDLDVTLVRVLWFVSIFTTGFGLLLYIVMALVVPLEPWVLPAAPGTEMVPGAAGVGSPLAYHRHAAQPGHAGGLWLTVLGTLLIFVGGMALVGALVPAWISLGRFIWPASVAAFGIVLVVLAFRGRQTAA